MVPLTRATHFGTGFLSHSHVLHGDLCPPTPFPLKLMRLWVKTVLGSHFGVGEFTTHFRTYFSTSLGNKWLWVQTNGIPLVVGLNRMFTGGTGFGF